MQQHQVSINNDTSFRRAPSHETVAHVPTASLEALLADLAAAQYDSVEVLTADAGLAVLDQHGDRHGLRGRLVRALQQLGTEEANLIAYADALRHGRAVVGVLADPQDGVLVSLLARHDAEHVISYGRWSATEW